MQNTGGLWYNLICFECSTWQENIVSILFAGTTEEDVQKCDKYMKFALYFFETHDAEASD